MNLQRFWSMEEDAVDDDGRYGSVLDEAEFLAYFGANEAHQHGSLVAAGEVASA